MRLPEYQTTADHAHNLTAQDQSTLPAGSFVIPLELCYVPKHVRDDRSRPYHDKEKNVYVYCRYGIVSIPKALIRRCV